MRECAERKSALRVIRSRERPAVIGTDSEFPVIRSVVEGTQGGSVYIVDGNEFVMHKSGFGRCDESIDPRRLLDFVGGEQAIPAYFHLFTPSDGLVDRVQHDDRFGFKLRRRVRLRHRADSMASPGADQSPSRVTLETIGDENFDSLEIFGLDLTSRFWRSKADFLGHSYGVLARDDAGNPASLCYASSIADGRAEIDIATVSTSRGQGLGTIVGRRFIELSVERGLEAIWDCFLDNTASLQTARRLGFSAVREYSFLSVFQKDRPRA